MQILSPQFCHEFKNRIINVHHSLLPAFPGAHAYRQAHNKGVKLIGATAHYVTEELDAGPIIAQEAISCSHEDSVDDLKRKGAVVETRVLLRAVQAHLEGRIFVLDNQRTVVFLD